MSLRNGLLRFVAGVAILEFVKFNLKTLLRYFMYEDRFSILDIGTLFGANAFGAWLMSRYLKTLEPISQVVVSVAKILVFLSLLSPIESHRVLGESLLQTNSNTYQNFSDLLSSLKEVKAMIISQRETM